MQGTEDKLIPIWKQRQIKTSCKASGGLVCWAKARHPTANPWQAESLPTSGESDLKGGPVCVKRALPRLKVAADWRAPVERGAYEARWMQLVGAISPESVPRLLGRDPEAGLFVMEFLDPSRFPLWKAELSRGRVDPNFAALVGSRIGWIHAIDSREPGKLPLVLPPTPSSRHFVWKPYLRTTAIAHPDRARQLEELASLTARTRLALVHGDVSPKNLLVGPRGARLPGLRVCLVWRSRFRPRFLLESSAAQMPAGKICNSQVAGVL